MARILVVDDDPATAALVRAALEGVGHAITLAGNGAEALLAVNHAVPDLVVMDVMMPVMDGFQALHVLKSDPATVDLPVVLLTARSGDVDMARGWRENVDFYLTKPFSVEELLTVVGRILTPNRAQA